MEGNQAAPTKQSVISKEHRQQYGSGRTHYKSQTKPWKPTN